MIALEFKRKIIGRASCKIISCLKETNVGEKGKRHLSWWGGPDTWQTSGHTAERNTLEEGKKPKMWGTPQVFRKTC